MGKLWIQWRYSLLGEKVRSLVPHWLVNNFFHLPVAVLAVLFFGYPAKRLKVIGVTGTDGKTTTATLIHKILVDVGKKAALISTVSAKIGREEISTGLHVTSPHPWKLQQLLRRIVKQGLEYVVLEATSHGLVQNRLFGCNFMVGVVTNVTHEHLDYHGTYEKYLAAKAKLFRRVKVAVFNRDDRSYRKLMTKISKQAKVITYSIKQKADFTPKTFKFKTSLPGEYNQYNCLAAIAATSSLGLAEKKIRKAVAGFKGIKGRMEEIDEGQDFRTIVDFAHTPYALESALKALKKQLTPKSKHRAPSLIAVFGCAGLRDKQKWPMMGRIAAQYADQIVLTAEDPRTEDVNQIIEEIAQGYFRGGGKKANLFRVPDRREAIKFAIQKLAKKGDIVVVFGKGHEESMCFGRTEYPWSDQKEIRQALKKSV